MTKHLLASLLLAILITVGLDAYGQNQIITTPDPSIRQFTVPAGVTSLTVEVWGAGGKGGSRLTSGEGGGGGGGAYSRSVIAVTPGQVIDYYVGFGSLSELPGEDTWFINNTTLMAKGGNSVINDVSTGASGGSAASGFGTTKFSGGNGANATLGNSGGGGSSAGVGVNGNNAILNIGGVAPTGGARGGNGLTNGQNRGDDGQSPGGGGGGARRNNASGTEQIGGYGGNGQIRISYISLTSAAGTDNQSVCITTPITTTTYTVPSGSTVTVSNLPAGLSSNYNASTSTLTISGTPTASGTYTITTTPLYFSTLVPPVTLTRNGSVTVIPNNTVNSSSPNRNLCINTSLTTITHTTTGATGIANNGVSGANGLPPGVSATWAANTISITGTPTASGTYNYSILLTGGCGAINAIGTITVNPNNTVSPASSSPTLCINTTLGSNITHTTTGATGISNAGVSGANGLPAGMSATWSASTITISGTPTASGTFNYSIPLTGGCGAVNATGTITVNPNNTASAPSSTPVVCINTPLTNITHTTTGATGIGSATGLPSGVTANWASNTITISGTPTVSGNFSYSIALTGGCGNINATGTITVNANNTVSAPSSTPTLCINTPLSNITHTTTGATGISNSGVSGANGLPTGLSATWASGVITISGTPTQAGTFNYSIPLTGGCFSVSAIGTITVNPATAITSQNMADQRICIGNSFTNLSVNATGVGTLSYQWFSNNSPSKTGATPVGTNSNIYIPPSGSIGTKYYYVEVSSGCGPIATSNFSKATVEPITTITTQLSTADDVECFGDGFDPLTVVANGADLTYQWYSNTTQASTGGTLIPGATSNSFTPPSTDIGSILYYYVVVSGFCTSDTSVVSGFHRVNPPETVIDINPDQSDFTVCKGVNFPELTVLASGEGTISYQWYSNSLPENTGGTPISGATSANFTPPSNVVGTQYYYATGKSNCGTVPTAISGAYTVTAPTEILNQNLSGQTICYGSNFSPISVAVKGTGTISYQWYSNSTNSNAGGSPISGANSSSFTPPSLTAGTNYYYVVASSNCGPDQVSSISGAFTVNPLPVPTFESAPAAPICIGESTTYITQSGQSNYVWSGFGVEGTDYNITSGNISSSSNSVTVTWLTSGTKNISVRYTDPNGCTAGTLATNTLTVNPLPVSTFTTEPLAPICVGTSVTYTTQPSQSNYTWSVSGTQGTDYNITGGGLGASSNTVTLTWLTSGSKTVSVGYTNSNGCTTSSPVSNTLTVNPLPTPTFISPPGAFVCEQQSITYQTQPGKSNYIWNVPGTQGTDYIISSGGFGNSSSTATIQWLSTGSKTVTVRYTETTTGCVATTSASSTTQVQPYATIGLPVAATGQPAFPSPNYPSVCISSPSLRPFIQPTTGVIGIGTPTGLPSGVTAVFNSTTGNIEFSGNVAGVTPGVYTYSIPLNGNCINGQTATGTIEVSRNYQLTSVSAVSATVAEGSARVIINGTPANLPNGEYIVTYILDDGTPPPVEFTSSKFIVSNGTGAFSTEPLTDTNVDVYKVTIKSIKKVTDICEITLNQNDPKNYAFFSVCGATFDQNGTFTVPAGIYEITIQAKGAGAAPQTNLITIPVTPGEPLGIRIGLSGGAGSARDTYVTRDSSLPNPQTTGLIYSTGGGGPGTNGSVVISYSCPDPNKEDCIEIIDDGAKSGTTVIRFICDYQWQIPEGLEGFSVYAVGAGGGGGMGSTGGGGGGGGYVTTTINSTNPYGISAGNNLNISVGQGGLGATTVNIKGGNGGNSTVTATIPDQSGNISININALGGGGGGSFNNLNGNNGASGGGGAYSDQNSNTMGLGGSGTSGQGNNGGNGGRGQQPNHARAGGGGGGAASAGQLGDGAGVGLSKPGDGGNGSSFTIAGSSYGYGAGGGGIGFNFNGESDRQGLGGEVGGVILGGTASRDGTGGNGTIYTGSGGGAGRLRGGNGGRGVVYLSYLNFRILEVEYLYFEASYLESDQKGLLKWATSKEWENSHFEIERSINGVANWQKIGTVKGQGYSNESVEYQFTDENLPASGGIVYYRLKQVDFENKFAYSKVKSIQVDQISGKSFWVAYPNPSKRTEPVSLAMINTSVYNDELIVIRISDAKGVAETYTVKSIEEVSQMVNQHLRNNNQGLFVVQLIWGKYQQQLKILRN